MDHCCEDTSCDITAMQERHGRVLWVVLLINAVMFLVEGGAGVMAHSTSLLADALDMLGDTLVYGFSLFVLARSARWQAGAALAKGGFMLAFGLGVLGEAVLKAFHPVMPGVETMGVMGGLALAANLVCFVLLYRSRGDNLNMRSTWFCSRNDLMANGGVLLAAAGSYVLTSRWPDILVGVVIASLFLGSALHVLRQARQALRAPSGDRPARRGADDPRSGLTPSLNRRRGVSQTRAEQRACTSRGALQGVSDASAGTADPEARQGPWPHSL